MSADTPEPTYPPDVRVPRHKGATSGSFAITNELLLQYVRMHPALEAETIALMFGAMNVINPVLGAAARDLKHQMENSPAPGPWTKVPYFIGKLFVDITAALLG